MKVSIGSDHGGYELKAHLVNRLREQGLDVDDVGCDSDASVDYPDFAAAVAEKVAGARVDRGIVICTTGIGVSITANKFRGVRAALCMNQEMAEMTRLHNDSNVLCLSQKFTIVKGAEKIVDTWLATEFEGGRHQRRVQKIEKYEEG